MVNTLPNQPKRMDTITELDKQLLTVELGKYHIILLFSPQAAHNQIIYARYPTINAAAYCNVTITGRNKDGTYNGGANAGLSNYGVDGSINKNAARFDAFDYFGLFEAIKTCIEIAEDAAKHQLLFGANCGFNTERKALHFPETQTTDFEKVAIPTEYPY